MNDFSYFTGNMDHIIEESDDHRDLGVQISADGSFNVHIYNVIKKVRQKIGWMGRSFYSRDINFMRKLFTTVIRPNLDYCSQIWAPREGPLMDALEKVQKDFTRLIPELRHLSYSDRLKKLRITSLQRRYDRYRILYTRKILMGLVPDVCIGIRKDASARNGLKFEIPSRKN